ncbi:PAS domain-containing hybrid sensor histidine kinase/response regulator [Caldimonas thermodepolymerans]|uniref:histidine kinase n=1 Tax=Caldimonas thermodepolymerans TaxID=215580 RepID=A0AA46HWM3_9BURK|nr:PAS domain S-box protein [Caldimonas thermodepolymerans]TCP08310.1 PAS/PAC sensor hybrid histidine kinase [Caldimonas thermodepolymerans]UZG48577.1 PAS domain S-box protein [Caldimonas thermodepolymerans]
MAPTPIHVPPLPDEHFRLLVDAVQDYAIFMLDPQGHVVSWNQGAQKIKGYAADEVIGRHFSLFYPPEVAAAGWPQEELRRATRDGRYEEENWRVRKDGSRFWALVVITAMRDADGRLRGFAKVTRDLSERRRQEEALRRSEESFRLLVEGVKDYAIYMLDAQGFVRSWNAAAASIKGYAASEALGRHASMFYTRQDVDARVPEAELARAVAQGRAEVEGWRVRKDGSSFLAHAILNPLYDEHGQLRGYAKVTRDMTERRRLEELERSSRRMSEFLAMLAHELRNPLAPIRNAVSIMQLEALDMQRLRTCRDIIDRQLSHLTHLVDDLLDVGRIATGKIALKKAPMDLIEAVMRSVEAARPEFDARRQHLQLELPDEPVPLVGDTTRISQVVQNLLNNAAKFTPSEGQVTLRVRTDGRTAVIDVIDTGAGIAPDLAERMFDLFVQGHAAGTGSESGLGIGLTLARSLVEMHGGIISVHSDGPGRGSHFTVRLPLGPAEPEAGAPSSETLAGHGAHTRVLVVDDNQDSADSMAAVMELLGQETRVAYSGQQALAIAREWHPDAVLLDLTMPQSDGFEVLQALRALSGGHELYVAAMTGYAQDHDRRRTLQAGFDEHLPKPVDMDTLQRVLHDIERHRRQRQSGHPLR